MNVFFTTGAEISTTSYLEDFLMLGILKPLREPKRDS